MSTLWIETAPISPDARNNGDSFQENSWQAIFACQLCVRPFSEWVDLKWGFNAGALLEEFIDRQKLFIESQYAVAVPMHMSSVSQDQRSLTLRMITLPGEGLQVGLIGRVCAPSSEDAEKRAMAYARGLMSIVPYDYRLYMASSQADFKRIAGRDLLMEQPLCVDGQPGNSNIAEIKRGEALLPAQQGFQVVPGLWQASLRSNEQVWRAMAALPHPALLNIALQSTVMMEDEQQALWNIKKNMPAPEKNQNVFSPFSSNVSWGESYIKRRLAPWKKFFCLQVHVVQVGEFDEGLLRSIGAAITRDSADLSLPGYQWLRPASTQDQLDWLSQLSQSQIIQSFDRLEQLADLEEVCAVFRLPHHAPLLGLPGVNFLCPSTSTPMDSAVAVLEPALSEKK